MQKNIIITNKFKKVVDKTKCLLYNKDKLREKAKSEVNKMKKLNKYDFKVIDEFDCDITKTVSVTRVNNVC